MARVLVWLLLAPVVAHPGALYDLALRPVDQTNLALTAPVAAPSTMHCTVDAGAVRIAGPSAKLAYVFKGDVMYVIDTPTRTVHVLKHATASQLSAHYAEAVRQLEAAAAAAPPGERAAAAQKALDLKAVSERLQQPVVRDYRVTARFESADGRACRIWEEREAGAKRLELCVAPPAAVPGGAEILRGMRTLSRFRQGSNFALGVDFGLADWWHDIARLAGVPLLIREFKYDTVVSEMLLSGMREDAVGAATFELPDGYRIEEGPDYALWYVR